MDLWLAGDTMVGLAGVALCILALIPQPTTRWRRGQLLLGAGLIGFGAFAGDKMFGLAGKPLLLALVVSCMIGVGGGMMAHSRLSLIVRR